MDAKLKDLINDARKELRRASGVPLSSEEQAEVLRSAAIDKLARFIIPTFGVARLVALKIECLWTERGAVASLSSGDQKFSLRQGATNNEYMLLVIDADEERELLKIQSKDPLCASRVLVAIGDFLSPSASGNNES